MDLLTVALIFLGFILLFIVSMGLITITFLLTVKAITRIIFNDTFKDNENYNGKQ